MIKIIDVESNKDPKSTKNHKEIIWIYYDNKIKFFTDFNELKNNINENDEFFIWNSNSVDEVLNSLKIKLKLVCDVASDKYKNNNGMKTVELFLYDKSKIDEIKIFLKNHMKIVYDHKGEGKEKYKFHLHETYNILVSIICDNEYRKRYKISDSEAKNIKQTFESLQLDEAKIIEKIIKGEDVPIKEKKEEQIIIK